MDDTRDILAEVWKWLPVVRSVAETQSISRTAQALGTSPSAVSRALGRVEGILARQLFDRRGKKLILNPHGAELLESVRDAEDRVGRTLRRISQREEGGTIRVAAASQFGRAFVLPATRALTSEVRGVKVSIVPHTPESALKALEDGSLDLFVACNVAVGEPLVATKVADLELSVYAGKGHPLFSGSLPSPEEILRHAFVSQQPTPLMKPAWPRSMKREVTLWVDTHATGVEAVLSGSHLGAWERVMAAPYVEQGRLRELPGLVLPPVTLLLCHHGRSTEGVLKRLSEVISELAHVAVIRGSVSET